MAPVTIGIGNADFELGYLAKNSLMLNKGGLPGGGGGISPSSLSDGDICSMIVTRIFFRFLDFFSWNVPDISGVVLLELTEVPIVDPSSV